MITSERDSVGSVPAIGDVRNDILARVGRPIVRPEPIEPPDPAILGSAVANYSRRGTLRFSIGFNSSIRSVPIESLGSLPEQHLRENGDETAFLSSCQFVECVDALELSKVSPEWTHPITQRKMTFAAKGDAAIPMQWQGAVINGGRMVGGRTTTSSANMQVTSYNSALFGPKSSLIEHWLFIAGPDYWLPPTEFPSARRNLGTFRLRVFNESDNNALLLDGLIRPSPGTGGIAIQAELQKRYPDQVFNGKRIGFQVIHQVADSSSSPDGPDQRVIGALSGFGLVQMKPL